MSQGLSLIQATLVMITTMMGSGVIMMPRAINDLGYILGTLVLGGIAVCSFFTLYAVSYASDAFKKQKISSDPEKKVDVTYYNVTAHFSKPVATLVDLFMVIQGLGSCLCYLMALKKWIPLLLNHTFSDMGQFFLSMGLIVPLYGVSMQKNLSSLRHASFLSVGSVFYLVILCVYYFFTLLGVDRSVLKTQPLEAYNNNYYSAIGVMIFAVGCHQNIVQVFSELKKQTLTEISLVSLFCIIGGCSIYLLVGLCGYFVAGHDTSNDAKAILEVFLNSEGLRQYLSENTWDKNGILIKASLVAFSCVMLCAFPMQMHPARDAFLNIMSGMGMKAKIERKTQTFKYIITTVFCLAVFAVASIPNLKYTFVIQIIGATATNGITYMIPSIVFIWCVKKVNARSIASAIVGLLGVFMMVYMLYMQFTVSKKVVVKK